MLAVLCYPTIIGLCEVSAQLCLKSLSAMLVFAYRHRSYDVLQSTLFWSILGAMMFFALLILVWLRKCYSRFDVTLVLAVEFSAVTTWGIVAGLIVFQEIEELSQKQGVMMCAGLFVQLAALCIGARHNLLKDNFGPANTAIVSASAEDSSATADVDANELTRIAALSRSSVEGSSRNAPEAAVSSSPQQWYAKSALSRFMMWSARTPISPEEETASYEGSHTSVQTHSLDLPKR